MSSIRRTRWPQTKISFWAWAMLSSEAERIPRPIYLSWNSSSSSLWRAGISQQTIFTQSLVNQIITRRLRKLKTVGNIARPNAMQLWAREVMPPFSSRSVVPRMSASWAAEMSRGLIPSQALVMSATRSTKGMNTQSTITEPSTLKSTWPMAVRFAARLPESEASTGVMVVPMFPPRIMAQPRVNEIQPCEHMIRVMANVAAELCATIVMITPIAKKIRIEPAPIEVQAVRNCSISGFSWRLGTYLLIRSSPMKRKQKPIRNSPRLLYVPFFMKSIGTPMASSRMLQSEMLTSKENAEMIHVVAVVPTLAPKITAIACCRLMRPALTKLTTITVDADELWIRAVMATPVSTPVTRLRVITPRMLRRRSPATFCSPSLITFMPQRKRQTEPSRLIKSKML